MIITELKKSVHFDIKKTICILTSLLLIFVSCCNQTSMNIEEPIAIKEPIAKVFRDSVLQDALMAHLCDSLEVTDPDIPTLINVIIRKKTTGADVVFAKEKENRAVWQNPSSSPWKNFGVYIFDHYVIALSYYGKIYDDGIVDKSLFDKYSYFIYNYPFNYTEGRASPMEKYTFDSKTGWKCVFRGDEYLTSMFKK